MILDAHYHLEPAIESVEDLVRRMDASGIEATCLMAPVVQPFRVRALARILGSLMARSMAGPVPWIGRFFYAGMMGSDGTCRILGRRYRVYDVPDNSGVDRAIQAFPGRFYGWVFINPIAPDAILQLEQYKDRQGWFGAKAHPFLHRYTIERLDQVAQWCQEHNWPLLIHLGPDPKSSDFTYLPFRYPRLRLIYAHAAVPFYRWAWQAISGCESVWVDLSNRIYVDGVIARHAVRALGASRCVWGTDGPYDGTDYGSGIAMIERLGLPARDKDRILGQNMIDLIQPDDDS